MKKKANKTKGTALDT